MQRSNWESTGQRRLRFSGERVAIESGLGLGGVQGQKILKKAAKFFPWALSGLKEAAQDAVVLQVLIGASALEDFAHDGVKPRR